ncbi:MAG: SpvB/TcaC N-terminal domain-containing protein [Terriglobia bacterium]
MQGEQSPEKGKATAPEDKFRLSAPQLSLPKGGGAIRGIGEKFGANPVTGTGSMSVPIYASPGRLGFSPQLSLSYDSGAGNGPFGFGWSLALPSIARKTDKGLPRYADAEESDTFILTGAEDLVPLLVQKNGNWKRDVVLRTLYGKPYEIHRYRPRVEGLFARIERWRNTSDPSDTFWRSISKANITTWYGKTAESRIADPADATRIFTWLICETYDDKGNVTLYQYKAENSQGVDLTQACERNRSDQSRSAQRYIKNIFYGNRAPYFPDLTVATPVARPTDWCFQLVFDYGEHDANTPTPIEVQPWPCRPDPFSTYRPMFENRTYRLCSRALMFHNFPTEPSAGANTLVRSTDFTHSPAKQTPADPAKPFYSFLLSVTQAGYQRQGDGSYLSKAMPLLEFEYTEAVIDETVREVDAASIKNLPYGLDGKNYRWVDLDGEGISGILTEQGSAWFYKPNLSPANLQSENGVERTLPQFGPVELVTTKPSLAALGSGRQQLLDLSGDGQLDLVDFNAPTPGYFERTEDEGWEPFASFQSLPALDWQNPNLKLIDLDGDGHADILISEDSAFWWYTSLAAAGFGSGQRVAQAVDEEKGPKLVFADGAESIFLADLSGDGLTDLVRVRNGEVCYWPNLGYGRFGAKVTMDEAPWFDTPDLFDGRRIRLADIDGSGTSDIIYFASRGVDLYFNQSGNAWGAKRSLGHFPRVENLSSATALDLLGNGTACLVWSSALVGNARQPMRYVDLMGGQKPHLLVHAVNNLGSETRVQYAPSTKFYAEDKIAGTPWLTRIPFPLHVVERVETYDDVSRNRFVTRYAYHHGYYDGVEREFRGFGKVEQWDTEEFATLTASGDFPNATNIDTTSNIPPVKTVTWFHTGAFFGEAQISRHFEQEYYREGDSSEALAGLTDQQLEAMLLDDTVLPGTVFLPDGIRAAYDLTGEEMREACRALRGSVLRQEVYAEDGVEASDRPYNASERNYTIELFQPQGPNRYAVFFVHARESIEFHYERKLYKVMGNALADPNAPPPGAKSAADPRVTHSIILAVDIFGNSLQSIAVGYGRRYLDPALTPPDQSKQATTLCTYTENSYTNAVLLDDAYRVPAPAESSTYELIQVQSDGLIQAQRDGTKADLTYLFGFDELQRKVKAAGDGLHDILFENLNPTGLNAGEPYRRLISRKRTLYRPNDMGAGAGDPRALLPLRKQEFLALPGESYKLAFTPGLIPQVYQKGGAALLPTPAAVLGSVGPDGGGYVDLDGDGHWWMHSGRAFDHPDPTATSAQELAQAQQHFFLPRRFEDAFGNVTTVAYDDPHDLLVVQSVDAMANTVAAANDYRVLKATQLTDPNGNRSAVSFDVLAMVAGTAVMGKATENLGDSLAGFAPNLTTQQIDNFYAAGDPHTLAGALLGSATTRIVYDLDRFQTSRAAAPNDPTKWEPVFAATVARETHASDLGAGQQSLLQITFSYSDGFGRIIQKKAQAEPGPAVDGGPTMNPRWVGSGWTIYNNKGKPVRKYEPFFSQLPTQGHQFEFGLQMGVSPILFYDPLERVMATTHPNHIFDKVVLDPWHQATWDVNDTVLQADPKTDSDVGDFFRRLPDADYVPTWYAQRTGGALGSAEQDAATKAAAHANTPTVTFFDALGRTILTIADNGPAGKYSTRTDLDIQGNPRLVTDARSNPAMATDFDLVKRKLHSKSDDAGELWALADVLGKPIRAWDSRGFQTHQRYDELRRPSHLFTQLAPAPELLVERIVYVDRPDSGWTVGQTQAANLRGRPYQAYDGAGVVTSQNYDFKGNLMAGSRQLASNYQSQVDWAPIGALNDIGKIAAAAAALIETEVFSSSTTFDALNRPVTLTTPDGSIIKPVYNEANLLQQVSANLRAAAAASAFITNFDYNAKGQRTLCEYANGVKTTYQYDPLTHRLKELTSTRIGDNTILQDLNYTYDPVGNVTQIDDNAQQPIFFSNAVITATAHHVYDAIYRLIQSDGREHAGQTATPQYDWNDSPRIGLPQPGDGTAMRAYTEQYQYDAVGNILSVVHQALGGNWTRQYQYASDSDRLLATSMPGDPAGGPYSAKYTFDANGNVTAMPHLSEMDWNFKNQFQRANLGGGGTAYFNYDAAGIRVRKVTVKNGGTLIEQRIYLSGYEIFRQTDGAGNVKLERQTLHIMDDKRRVAMVETKTLDSGAPVALPISLMRYQFDNNLGSATLELDASGAIISYEEFYPYGATSYQAVNGAIDVSPKRYRYTGKERDDETGLYYHGARYYAPWLGRWTSCDPKGLVDGANLYSYVRNNPIRLADPSGQQATSNADTQVSPVKKQMDNTIHQAATQAEKKADALAASMPQHVPQAPDLKLEPRAPIAKPSVPHPGLEMKYDTIADEPYLVRTDLTPGSPEWKEQQAEAESRLQKDTDIVNARIKALIDKIKAEHRESNWADVGAYATGGGTAGSSGSGTQWTFSIYTKGGGTKFGPGFRWGLYGLSVNYQSTQYDVSANASASTTKDSSGVYVGANILQYQTPDKSLSLSLQGTAGYLRSDIVSGDPTNTLYLGSNLTAQYRLLSVGGVDVSAYGSFGGRLGVEVDPKYAFKPSYSAFGGFRISIGSPPKGREGSSAPHESFSIFHALGWPNPGEPWAGR